MPLCYGRLPMLMQLAGAAGRAGRARRALHAAFLAFLDNTIVSVGLGNIQTDLKASVAELQWVVGGYALDVRLADARFRQIGDELGRKKVMLTGAGVFCAGSVLCASPRTRRR